MYFILSIGNKLVYNIVFLCSPMTKVPGSRSLSSLQSSQVLLSSLVCSGAINIRPHHLDVRLIKHIHRCVFIPKQSPEKAENIILKSKKSLKLSRLKSEAIEILKCIIPTLYTTNFKPCHS